MITTFIKDTPFKFDLGNVYRHILLNKDQIEPKIAIEAYHSLRSFQKGKVEPKFPFYPKNWEFIKNTLVEYQRNNLESIPNKFYFIKATFDEGTLTKTERDLIHVSTAIDLEDGGIEYDWDKWKLFQYDIYSTEDKFILEWQNTESHKYWLSWYLTLLDEALFNQDLLTNLELFTRLGRADLNELLAELHIKNLDLFLLSDWDLKLEKMHSQSLAGDIAPEEPNTSKSMTVKRPVSRKKGDFLTTLTSNQTNLLFRYLQQSDIIIKDPSIQSNLNLAKLISGLTGYNIDGQRNQISRPTKKDLIEIVKNLKKSIELINNDLK